MKRYDTVLFKRIPELLSLNRIRYEITVQKQEEIPFFEVFQLQRYFKQHFPVVHICKATTLQEGLLPSRPQQNSWIRSLLFLRQCPEYVTYLAKDLNDALRYAVSPPGGEKVNQVWVMGGSAVYQVISDFRLEL